MPERHKIPAASYLILEKDGEVLMCRRQNTGYEDGNYGLPSGHIEAGEHPAEALAREAQEEIGVEVRPEDMKFVHVAHRRPHGEGREYIDFFFLANNWKGEVRNTEPEKCDDCSWFSWDSLPVNAIEPVRKVLERIRTGQFYSEQY